jgi:hypothetical protein
LLRRFFASPSYQHPWFEVEFRTVPTNEEMYDVADKLKDQGKFDEAITKLNKIPAIRWRIER